MRGWRKRAMSLSDINSTPSDEIRSLSSRVLSSTTSTSSTNHDSSKLFDVDAHHAPRLIPVKTTSLPPFQTKVSISSMISSIGRHLCRPRAWTVRQKVQKLSHPVWMTIYLRVKSSFQAIFRRDRILVIIISFFSSMVTRKSSGSSGRISIIFLYSSNSSYTSKNRGSTIPSRIFPHPERKSFSQSRIFGSIFFACLIHFAFALSVTTHDAMKYPCLSDKCGWTSHFSAKYLLVLQPKTL